MNDLKTVFIEITNFCSKNCKHCFNSSFMKNPRYLSTNDLIYILKAIKKKNVKQIKIVGGEPLLHPEFTTVLEIMEEAKIPYIIVTDSEKVVNYLDEFRRSAWLKQIRISLDGIEKTHDFIRELGDFQKVIENVTSLKNNGIHVALNFTINKLNYLEIEEIWDLSRELGVDLLYGVVKHCDNKINEELLTFNTSEEVEKLLETINGFRSKNRSLYRHIWNNINDDDDFIISQKSNKSHDYIGCPAGQVSCVIDVSGDVWPCVLMKSENKYGNIFLEDFNLIWEKMNIIMTNLKRNFNECANCQYSERCTGGCRGNAFYFGDIQGKDPNCFIYNNYENHEEE